MKDKSVFEFYVKGDVEITEDGCCGKEVRVNGYTDWGSCELPAIVESIGIDNIVGVTDTKYKLLDAIGLEDIFGWIIESCDDESYEKLIKKLQDALLDDDGMTDVMEGDLDQYVEGVGFLR